MANKVYSSKQVTITVTPKGWSGPTLILNDGAPTSGTFVEIAMAADETTVTPMMEGGGTVNIMPGTNGTITVTLTGSANNNKHLSDARRHTKKTGEPRAWSIFVRDNLGSTRHSCPAAHIQGAPTDTFSESIQNRSWVFVCPELDMDHRESNDLGA